MHKSNMSAITICKIYLFILYSFWTLCSCSEVTFEHDVKMTKDETVVKMVMAAILDLCSYVSSEQENSVGNMLLMRNILRELLLSFSA